jgi:hypothetical protein
VSEWGVGLYSALLVFALLNLTDIITTYNVLRKHGVSRELNPLARALFAKFGVTGGFILKYLACGLLLLVGALVGELELSLWIWNVVLAAVTAWNSYVNLRDYLEERRAKGHGQSQ